MLKLSCALVYLYIDWNANFCHKFAVDYQTCSPTLHHGDWILHSGTKDIRSKHSGQVLNTHLILTGVRLDLIQKPEQRDYQKKNFLFT